MNIPEFAAAAGNIDGDSRELLDEIAEDTVMNEETVDNKPEVMHRAEIEYPESAAKERIQGYVVVHLLIAKDGSVQLAKVLEAEPQGVFETSVLNGGPGLAVLTRKIQGGTCTGMGKTENSI